MLRGRRESLRISASRGDEELRRTVVEASREVSFAVSRLHARADGSKRLRLRAPPEVEEKITGPTPLDELLVSSSSSRGAFWSFLV